MKNLAKSPLDSTIFVPAPFESDKPVSRTDENFDKIIAQMVSDVGAGRFENAARRIENGMQVGLLPSIEVPALTSGENMPQRFVYKSDELGEFIHFSLVDSRVRYFLPSACRRAAELGKLDVNLGMDSDPRTRNIWRNSFDVSCTPRVRLRLFSKVGSDTRFIDEIMIYRV